MEKSSIGTDLHQQTSDAMKFFVDNIQNVEQPTRTHIEKLIEYAQASQRETLRLRYIMVEMLEEKIRMREKTIQANEKEIINIKHEIRKNYSRNIKK